MKIFILLIVISIAFAIPQRTRQLAEVYPNEDYELSEASELLPENSRSSNGMGLEEPAFDSMAPREVVIPTDDQFDNLYPVEESVDDMYPVEESVDDMYPVDESPIEEDIPGYNIPADDFLPAETPVDEVIPEEDLPFLENYPEEIPVDSSTDNDTFIVIRYPHYPTYRRHFLQHPYLRIGPVFQWQDSDVSRDRPFFNLQPRRPSVFDMLFPELGRDYDTRVPDVIPSEESPNPSESQPGISQYGLHSFFNDFFDQPRRPVMPTFKFDNSNYPDNYSNSTHKIHDINGTKFAVNETIQKHAGDNFHNYFHVRVVHQLPNVPDEGPIPSRGDTVDTLDSEVTLPAEEPSEFPELPEAYNEADNELNPEISNGVDAPASYMLNDSPYQSSYVGNPRMPPKSLVGDTGVNRVASRKPINADAEVFDIEALLREYRGENE